jgi:hypothetical protein
VLHALVLVHPVEGLGLIAAPPVGHHDPSIVRGDHLLHCRMAMAGADLRHRGRLGRKAQQLGGLAPDAPAGVIGVHHRRLHDHRPQLLRRGLDRTHGAPPAILSHGPLR